MNSIPLTLPRWTGCLLATTGITFAQPVLVDPDITLLAATGNFEFGSAFAVAGDVNGDGVTDIAVADRSARVDSQFASGSVYIVSGENASVLRSYVGVPASSQYFGMSLASLDSNGDGVTDLAVGAPGRADGSGYGAGAVTIFSGVDGEVLVAVNGASGSQFGSAMTNAGDQNGDGVEDLFVSAPRADGFKGQVLTLSGVDGTVLRTLGTDAPNSSFASVLIATDDMDGDGRKELAVASPGFTSSSDFGVGRVQLVRSSDATVVAQLLGTGFYNRLGSSMAPVADANGDGLADLLVGSFWYGTLKVVSGADLSTIRDLTLTLPANRAVNAGGSIDYDGDGVEDWLIGSPGLGLKGETVVCGVRIISGADQSTLFERLADSPVTGLGNTQVVLPGVGFALGESRLFNADTGGYGAAYAWQIDVVLDSDGDGIPDDQDDNPFSNVDPTISILGLGTGVNNFVNGNGVTLADLFDGLGSLDDYRHSAHYFTSVVHLTNELVGQGLLTGTERKAINAAGREGAVKTGGKGRR